MDDLLTLKKNRLKPSAEILIPGSKSESNRLLIINRLYSNPIRIHNLSTADDTRMVMDALNSDAEKIDIGHAGTAMRFLTAYFSICENRKVILTGSDRMKQRPIGILANALKTLGADISYVEKVGFPPLKINGKKINQTGIELAAGVSSQFVSALMLIAPKLENGLTIRLKNDPTSKPYICMTTGILKKLGIEIFDEGKSIEIKPRQKIDKCDWQIESDYSSASYYFSLVALSENSEIKIGKFSKESFQGDSKVIEIYRKYFGVETRFEDDWLILKRNPDFEIKTFEINLNDTPDLAQTIAVAAAALKTRCRLTGLKTLKIKETDRLEALCSELKKIGVESKTDQDSIELYNFFETTEIPEIETFEDHRMAMSFAPLCLKRELKIRKPKVVEKSYPDFWNDFENCFLK